MEEAVQVRTGQRRSRGFVLGSLSFGHLISHFYDQSIPVILPTITTAFGLTTLQVAMLLGIRQGGFTLTNLAGPFVDMFRSQWGLILTGCVIGAAASFAIIGASPNYAVLIIAIIVSSIPPSLWHLPSTAALSQHFPDRRGFAISMHGWGSNIGNVAGPLLVGSLLGIFAWEHVMYIYAAPALLIGAFAWWSLKDVGRRDGETTQRVPGGRFHDARMLLKNPIILGLVLSSTFRAVALGALFNWTPFYLEKALEMGHLEAAFHFALLIGMGLVSAPIIGILSDRFDRKIVLVPGLMSAGVLSLLVVSAGDGVLLTLVMAGMGLFTFALFYVFQAAVLDLVGRGTEATTIAIINGMGTGIGTVSPFLASQIIDHLGGFGTMYYYSGIMTIVSAVIVMAIPLRRAQLTAVPAGR